MATRALRTLQVYRQEGNEGIIYEAAPGEEASQEYKKGAPLCYDISTDATKEIEEYAAGTASILIVGIAAKDATGTTGATVPYYEANDMNMFEASLISGTAAYTLLGTELGATYPLVKSGTDWLVNIADTANDDCVEIVGLIDDVGDVNPRVIVRILGGMQQKVLQS